MNAGNAVSVKQKKILKRWLYHCANLEKQYPLAAGVCADYGLDELKNVSGELKNFEHAEIESGAKALLRLIQKHLQSSYKEKARQGKEELMVLALEIFAKADALDRNERRDATTRTLFYNAWEFLTVAMSGVEVDESVKEKKRYAMWRAAEISNALKENREPLPPPLAVQDDESLVRELERDLGGFPEQRNQTYDELNGARAGDNWKDAAAAAAATNGSDTRNVEMNDGVMHSGGRCMDDGQTREYSNDQGLVGIRDYISGQDVIYSEDASGYQNVEAIVCSVIPGGRSGQRMYDILTQDGRRLQVSSEFLAPDVTCGEELVLEGSGEAVVEEIYGSQWPPRYLVKTKSGLVQASDEDLRYCPIPGKSKIEEEETADGGDTNGENECHDVGPPVKNEAPPPNVAGGQEDKEFVDIPQAPGLQDRVPQIPADSDDTVAVEDSDVPWHRQDPWPETSREIASAPEANDIVAQTTDGIDGSPESVRFDGEISDYIDSYPLSQGIFVNAANTGHGEAQKALETKKNVHTKAVRTTTYSTDVKDLVDAEKCIKNASSALQFNDVGTAVKYLYEALNLLEIKK